MEDEKLPAALRKIFDNIDADTGLDDAAKELAKKHERTAYRAKMKARKIRARPAEGRRKEQTWGQQMIGIALMARCARAPQQWANIKEVMGVWFEKPADQERWNRFVAMTEEDWTTKAAVSGNHEQS